MTQRVPLSPRQAVNPSEVTVTPSLALNTACWKPSKLHTSGCWTAAGFHLYLIQEVQQQGLYMVIKRSSMVNQKMPKHHPSLFKTQDRGLLQNNSLVRKVLYAETWPVPRLVLFANKSLTEEKNTVTHFWEVRWGARSTESTFALAGRGGVP